MRVLAIILPIFLVVGLGYALRRARFLDAAVNEAFSRLVFYVAAPALLLHGTARGGPAWGVSAPLLLVVTAATVLLTLGTYAALARMAPARRGVWVQGAFRSNTVFLGLPLVMYAYGEEALGFAGVLIALLVILENVLAVLVLALPHEERSARDPRLWLGTVARTLLNPLVLATLAGILIGRSGLVLPLTLDRTLDLIGRTAAPLGLLCVGAGLDFARLRDEISATATASAVKLVAYPAAVYAVLRLLGFGGPDLRVTALVLACPTAVISYIMAREMRGDGHLASAIVIGTTAASLATLAGWLIVLGARP